jgi:hypothetical protein
MLLCFELLEKKVLRGVLVVLLSVVGIFVRLRCQRGYDDKLLLLSDLSDSELLWGPVIGIGIAIRKLGLLGFCVCMCVQWFYGPSDPTWILPTYDDPIVPQRAAYEQQMPELPNRRAYVKAAAQSPPPPLPTTYYRLYPKVQTVTDGPPVRTVVEEPRDRVVEAGVPVVSQDAVRRESQLPPPPPPLKNLVHTTVP